MMDQQGKMLCWIDDLCLTEILDPSLEIQTHRTGVEEMEIKTQKDKQILKKQRAAYAKSLADTSRIKYEKCDRYPRDFGVGVKIVAKRCIYMDTRIDELYGQMAKVPHNFFSIYGIRDYSVVITEYTNETKLWLGPAGFVNHDCEANASICSVGGAAIVKALRKIKPGDEITINYGPNYFGKENTECMCNSCEIKGTGHFQINNQGACMMPEADNEDYNQDNNDIQQIRKDLYVCAICNQPFLYKSWLALHIAKHMEPTHVCDKCDRVFRRKDALDRHIQIVHNKKRYPCNECIKDFATSYGVTRHRQNTHSNENIRHNCPKCPLTFGCLQDLGYHDNLIHTGLKPYRCSNILCNRVFETPYLLHMHKAIHGRRN